MRRAICDTEKLRELIEVQKLQQWKAAELLGVSQSSVERACARLGLKTAKSGPRRGPEHPDWQGGRTLRKGYWHVWMPGHPNAHRTGYIAEHRMLMGEKLGRPLQPHEVVHHIDGDPQNNAIENLIVFQTNAEHLKTELTGRIPKWTPQGKELIAKGIQRSAILRQSKRGGSKRTRTTGHPASKP